VEENEIAIRPPPPPPPAYEYGPVKPSGARKTPPSPPFAESTIARVKRGVANLAQEKNAVRGLSVPYGERRGDTESVSAATKTENVSNASVIY
jgi:hypothetical protein